MDCNLNGEKLSKQELIEIAIAAGIEPEKIRANEVHFHNNNMFRSWLSSKTKDLRFAMWSRGELRLHTSPE